MPLPGEIGKAYKHYYTHTSTTERASSPLKQFYRLTKRRWLSSRYGYPTEPQEARSWLSHIPHYFLPTFSGRAFSDVRFLPFVEGGRLLDVGCGNGDWMATMAKLGWGVEGVDFDPAAVKSASNRGLTVHFGSVESQKYPADSFDAINMNQVIEHVPDPVGTVTECFRILKPGGRLVLVTPNAASLSHRYFKQSWRGLEQPRHLHIFTFDSIRNTFTQAGFKRVAVGPIIGTSVSFESSLIKHSQGVQIDLSKYGWRSRPFWRLFSLMQHLTIPLTPLVGECLCATAVKS